MNYYNKLIFTKESPFEVLKKNKSMVMNFQNMYSLYLFRHEKIFRDEIIKDRNIIFPDGKNIARYLGIKQQRGPTFTKDFLLSKGAKNKKHFFIGDADSVELSRETCIKKDNFRTYNPPYIKGKIEFSMDEKEKIVGLMKRFNPDYVWICIGNPKQEILANQLYKLYPCIYINIGAALDFLLDKKAEASIFWRLLGIEWFYRLITDFKYSRIKVWKSFVALGYLKYISLDK